MQETFLLVKDLLEEYLTHVFEQLEQIIEHYPSENALSVDTLTIKRIWQRLRDDTFQIMMLGHFSSGKSTLLNALIGHLPLENLVQDPELKEVIAETGVLPISDLPTTPVITYLSYAERPRVFVQSISTQRWKEQTLDWYLQEVRARPSVEENLRVFADISQIRLELPVHLCQTGITLVDVPGVENSVEHNLLVEEALEVSDTAIALVRSDQLVTLTEHKYLEKLRACGITRYFTIVNLFDKRRVDDVLKSHTWERLVREMSAQDSTLPYDGQNFANKQIYFVDVLRARKAKFTKDHKLLKISGLATFEEALVDFLRNERLDIHVTRFIDETVSAIEKLLHDTQAVITTCIAKRRSVEMLLEDIQEKVTRDKRAYDKVRRTIHATLHRYQTVCKNQLYDDYAHLLNQICLDLPTYIEQQPLPTLHQDSVLKNIISASLLAPLQRQKLFDEAQDIASHFINNRIAAWFAAVRPQVGAQQSIAPWLSECCQELQDALDDLKLLSQPLNARHDKEEKSEIDQSALFTMFTSTLKNSRETAMNRQSSSSSSENSFLAGVVAATALMAPFLIIPSVLLGAMNTEKDIKTTLVRLMIEGDAAQGITGLRMMALKTKPYLDSVVDNLFANLEQMVDTLYKTATAKGTVMQEHLRHKQEIEALNQQIERTQLDRQNLVTLILTLQDAENTIRQTIAG